MNKNKTLILEKLDNLKKYDGAFIISFGEFYIQFSKEFLKKTIYCEAVSHNYLKKLEKTVDKDFETLNFKIIDKNYFKNYKLTENLKIVEEVEYIFKEIYKIKYDEKIKIEDLIEYSEISKNQKNENRQNLKSKNQKQTIQNNTKQIKYNQVQNTAINYKWIFIVCFILFLVFIGYNSENKVSDIGSEAFVVSKTIIKRDLLTPSVAEFGSFQEAKIVNLGNNEYDITNYVDTENAYGAKIRKYYNVKLKYKNGEWTNPVNWEIENINIE